MAEWNMRGSLNGKRGPSMLVGRKLRRGKRHSKWKAQIYKGVRTRMLQPSLVVILAKASKNVLLSAVGQ